MTQVVW
ncbi:unnamed protein product [Linum tenue]|nr:unnamed protein product [Linum tenue]